MNFDDLTGDERQLLSMHANYELQKQDDWRYQNADPDERHRLKTRWREIGDALDPAPWRNGA